MTASKSTGVGESDRYAVVASRFNEEIVERLLAGAIDEFARQGIEPSQYEVVHVPGAFELPLAAKRLAETGKFAAVVCLGAVIRGETDHYEHVSQAAANGILRVGIETNVPCLFGVLTCDDEEQALDRSGGAHGNKGADAVRAAIEMVQLFRRPPLAH